MICSPLCRAETPKGKLAVILEDREKKAIDGLDVYITKVADFIGADYTPAAGFESSGISITAVINDPSEANAKDLFDFVKKNKLAALTATSASGKAEFEDLDAGIWLVYCGEEGRHSFNPYLVFLPYEAEGELCYEASSAPKTDVNVPHKKSIYVMKKWVDQNDAAKKRPSSITVELRENGDVIDTAVLNDGNGWAHTFTELREEGKYSVSEVAVENYTVQCSGDSENGFLITNTYNGEKLPQTGQLWWPIMLMAVAGIAFVLLGIIEIGARKNEKKSK